MKSFLTKIALFAGSYFAAFILLECMPGNPHPDSLHYAVIDKHELLRKTENQPRVLLVGGSNISFGIYSPKMEETLGMPVIDTAINAGYGLKYILDDIEPFIRKGDIVIVMPEYHHFYDELFWGSTATFDGLRTTPENVRNIGLKQATVLAKDYPQRAKSNLRFCYATLTDSVPEPTHPHRRDSFNANGDIEAHWKIEGWDHLEGSQIDGPYNPATIDYLSRFVKSAEKKGAHVYISFPTYSEGSFGDKENKESIDKIYKELYAGDFKLLGTPARYSFPDSLYFNSHYHPYKEGQLMRTERLIEDLRNALSAVADSTKD